MKEAVTTIERIIISNKSAFFNLKIMNKRTIVIAGINLINKGITLSLLSFQIR